MPLLSQLRSLPLLLCLLISASASPLHAQAPPSGSSGSRSAPSAKPNPAQLALNRQHTADIAEAKAAALQWLHLLDSGSYGDAWKRSAPIVHEQVSRKEWEEELKGTRTAYGKLTSRTERDANYANTLPGAPDGSYVVFELTSSFAHKQSTVETVVMQRQQDSSWQVAGYFLQ